jgi:hypothetical protein
MLIAGVVVILFIVGLFLEMLSSSPRAAAEWETDTDRDWMPRRIRPNRAPRRFPLEPRLHIRRKAQRFKVYSG